MGQYWSAIWGQLQGIEVVVSFLATSAWTIFVQRLWRTQGTTDGDIKMNWWLRMKTCLLKSRLARYSFHFWAFAMTALLIFVLISAALKVQNKLEKDKIDLNTTLAEYRFAPTAEQQSFQRITGGIVPLSRTTMTENSTVIVGWAFEGVTFVGPCIVTFIDGTTIEDTMVETPLDKFLIATSVREINAPPPAGLIIFAYCVIDHCYFEPNIGFLGGIDQSKEIDEIQHMRDCAKNVTSDNFTIGNWP